MAVLAASSLLAFLSAMLMSGSAQGATLPTLTLTVEASSITVGGTPPAGAVNVVSVAAPGVKEASAILFELKPGVSAAEAIAALASKATQDPNSLGKYGSIVFDAEAAPSPGSEAQTVLPAGEYLALGGGGEGPPKGHATFKIAAGGAPAVLATPQATVKSIEFGFKGPSTLKTGELVRFENEGFLVHMDIAFPARNHAAALRAAQLLKAGKEKQAQKLIAGPPVLFGGPVSSGAFQQEIITAKPGWYVQACFMDTQDGRSHTLLGMERVIKIA